MHDDFLDAGVVSEVGKGKSLAAQKEILDLLQVALGEEITRQGVNVGLDDLHESDLAPGSLTRALNDFFNTMEELSASPFEPAIKQELYHKIQTLTKRFNEAGQSLEQIEAELSKTFERSVDEVNRILGQIHEANLQVRRFELLDQGKAVSYRDERQALLEKLAGYVNFTTQAEVNEQNKPTGFLNLFVEGKNGSPPASHAILNNDGVIGFTNDWGQEFNLVAPVDTLGSTARVRAKIGSDGKLGRFEILDGGSRYDIPRSLCFSLASPKTKDSTADQAAAGQQAQQQLLLPAVCKPIQLCRLVNQLTIRSTTRRRLSGRADAAVAGVAPVLRSEEGGEVFYQGTNTIRSNQ